jgi:hypothetical protein
MVFDQSGFVVIHDEPGFVMLINLSQNDEYISYGCHLGDEADKPMLVMFFSVELTHEL